MISAYEPSEVCVLTMLFWAVVCLATALAIMTDLRCRRQPNLLACPLVVLGPIWIGIVIGLAIGWPALLNSAAAVFFVAIPALLLCWRGAGPNSTPRDDDQRDAGTWERTSPSRATFITPRQDSGSRRSSRGRDETVPRLTPASPASRKEAFSEPTHVRRPDVKPGNVSTVR